MPKKIVAVAVILAFTATSCIVHTARPHSPDPVSRDAGLREKAIVRTCSSPGRPSTSAAGIRLASSATRSSARSA